MKKYVKGLAEFAEFKLIKEALMIGGAIEIPGLNFVSATVEGTEIILSTETGRVKCFNMDNLMKLSKKTEADCPSCMVQTLNKLFQSAIISKVDSWLPTKINVLKQAESYELFDEEISAGGFFADLDTDLIKFGMSVEDITVLTADLYDFYSKGHVDNMSPEGHAILREYLDYLMEIIASKTYIFLQLMNKAINNQTQGPNQDETNLGNNTNTKNDPSQFTLTNETLEILESIKSNSVHDKRYLGVLGSDYEANLNMITHTLTKLADELEFELGDVYDYETGREVNATTKNLAFPIEGTSIVVTSIFSPVELKRLTNQDVQTFSIEDGDGGFSETNIIGADALATALKKVV